MYYLVPIFSNLGPMTNRGMPGNPLPGMTYYGRKWLRLALNGTNTGLFHIRFQYILAEPKCTEVWYEKVSGLSHLGTNWPTLGPSLSFLNSSQKLLNNASHNGHPIGTVLMTSHLPDILHSDWSALDRGLDLAGMAGLALNWVKTARIGINLGLFKISFSIVWLAEPKCSETDLKKSEIYLIWGQSDPIWNQPWYTWELRDSETIMSYRCASYDYSPIASKTAQKIGRQL